jgi:ABC-type uncharacterized transport system auxiliary subunit
MNRATGPILFSLLALILSGCAKTKPIRYYAIQSSTAPTLSSGTSTVSLLVAEISTPAIFRDSPIAYRIGTNEVGTYQYSRWIEPPVELVHYHLIHLLRSSGTYQSVDSLGSASGGQFVVRGHLYDFEEVDGAGGITGLVSMDFQLYDRKAGKVVWSHGYSQSEPVQGKEISAIVTALDVNLERGLKEVAAGLDQYFAANPAGKS